MMYELVKIPLLMAQKQLKIQRSADIIHTVTNS